VRALIRSAIIGDATMNGLGIVGANAFAVDVDTPQTRPFLQLRWGVVTPGIAVVNRRFLVVWCHDKPGDYSRIDQMLLRLRALLPTIVGISDSSGSVVDIEWTGDSEDLSDDGHGTIARTASFTVVGSGQ
jgi:hypothetical protein